MPTGCLKRDEGSNGTVLDQFTHFNKTEWSMRHEAGFLNVRDAK